MKRHYLILLVVILLTVSFSTALADDETNTVVARIGEQTYTSLKAAVDAAQDGDVIQMVDDCEVNTTISIAIKSRITLDLSGFIITIKNTSSFMSVSNNGQLIIKDSKTDELGEITYDFNDGKVSNAHITLITVEEGGKLIIDGGKFVYDETTNNGCRFVRVNIGGTLIINNGSFETTAGNYGAIHNQGTTIINGGTITNNCTSATSPTSHLSANCISSSGNSSTSLIINGGTFNSKSYAIYIGDGKYSLSPSATYNGKISINGVDALVLSDNVAYKENIATTTEADKVIYTRKVSNSWGTVCLPFVPKQRDDVTYYSVNKLDNESGTIDVSEVSQTNMKADTPYLFMLNNAENNIYTAEADDVTFNVNDGKIQSPIEVNIGGESGWKFTGVYEETQVFADASDHDYKGNANQHIVPAAYYIHNNGIHHVYGYFQLKPYRAYFVAPSGQTSSNSFEVAVIDEATGLDGVPQQEVSEKDIVGIYTLNGHKQATLQPGINIVRFRDGTSRKVRLSSQR